MLNATPAPAKALTKSDFVTASTCPVSLKHKRDGLRASCDEDDFLRLLSEGGAMVEALVDAGRPPDYRGPTGTIDPESAAAQSKELIQRAFAEVCAGSARSKRLREITIICDGILARLDCLDISVNAIELGEIKSKTMDHDELMAPMSAILTKGKERRVKAEWVPYMQDIALQRHALRRFLAQHGTMLGVPNGIVLTTSLILLDKSARAGSQDSIANLQCSYELHGSRAIVHCTPRQPLAAPSPLLKTINVDAALDLIDACLQSDSESLKGLSLADAVTRISTIVEGNEWAQLPTELGAKCKNCEFRSQVPALSGFHRCWGSNVSAPDHILRLTYVKSDQVAMALTSPQGVSASLTVLQEGSLQPRQLAQWRAAGAGHALVDPGFAQSPLDTMRAPQSGKIGFLDFEASGFPIPSHPGRRPYELEVFQFEGHVLPDRTAPLHARSALDGYLDISGADCRRKLVDALIAQFNGVAVIYVWSGFESRVIRGLIDSIRSDATPDPADQSRTVALQSVLDRLVDLLAIAKSAFIHPGQSGSYSMKKLLPVVWQDPAIRAAFSTGAASGDPSGYLDPSDPYKSLPRLDERFIAAIGGDAVIDALGDDDGVPAITNGGAAARYFHWAKMFGGAAIPAIEAQFRAYCRLDSAAMVMTFDYMRRVVPKFAQSKLT